MLPPAAPRPRRGRRRKNLARAAHPVDYKARRVDALDGRLAEGGREVHRAREEGGVRVVSADHLDELHQLHR
eukprot:2292477-Prymnesium_polylepis.2